MSWPCHGVSSPSSSPASTARTAPGHAWCASGPTRSDLRRQQHAAWQRLPRTAAPAEPGSPAAATIADRSSASTSARHWLATGQFPPEIATTWGKGSSAPSEIRRCGAAPGARSQHLHPGHAIPVGRSRRCRLLRTATDGIIETGAIALLSNYARPPIDAPSSGWLGHHSTRTAIRESGLWNVNHVRDNADGAFLAVLRRHVERAGA